MFTLCTLQFIFWVHSVWVHSIYLYIYVFSNFFNKRAETVVSERAPGQKLGRAEGTSLADLQLTITLDVVYLALLISIKFYSILLSRFFLLNFSQERQQLDRRYQCIRKSIAKNASLFLQESPKNELPPPTITPQKQRDLLVKVFLNWNSIVVMDLMPCQIQLEKEKKFKKCLVL